MARILAYTYPSRGHLYPLVPTLQELHRRRHDVRVLTMSLEVESLRQLGLDASPVDPRLEKDTVDDWRARTPIGAQRREVAFLASRAPVEMADLRAALTGVDGLLIDSTTWGAQIAAEASGLPWAMVGHFPLPIASPDAPPYGLGLAPRADRLGRWRDALARRLVLEPLGRLILPKLNELRGSEGLRPVRDGTDLFAQTAPLVLYCTAEPFEYPRREWPESVRLVGPGVWDPPAAAPPWLRELTRPIVLVTCSSEFQDDGRLAEVALPALASAPYDVVVTTAAVDPAGLPSAPNAHVARYLPHRPILDRAVCVVCHAGMGITQKALAAGVPVCAVPFGRDQFEVARRVVVAGAGSMVPARRLRPKRLRAAVEEAIARSEGARRIARAFANAGGAAAAADAFEELIRRQRRWESPSTAMSTRKGEL
jgi:MGT family glycosyltransferase